MENSFLSGAALKAKAKDTLTGKYSTFVLATLTAILISTAAKYIISFFTLIFFSMSVVIKEMLSGQKLLEVQQRLSDVAYMQGYSEWYNAINYVLQIGVSIFTSLFYVGISFLCLNAACGKSIKVSDVFYCFRNQTGKSLQLTAISVLLSQIALLPANFVFFLIRREAPPLLLLCVLSLLTVCMMIYIPLSLSISQMFLLLLDFPGYSAIELIRQSTHIMKGQKSRLFCLQLSFLPLIFLSLLTFGIGNLWLLPYMKVTYTHFFLNLMRAREATLPALTY